MTDSRPEAPDETSMSGCFFSVIRNLVGPGLLLVMGAGLLANRPSIGSVLDLLFLAVLALVVLVGVFFRPKAGPLKPGEAAGMARPTYVIVIAVAGAAIWAFAHFILRQG